MLGRDRALAIGRYVVTDRSTGREAASGLFSLVMLRRPEGWRIIHDHSSLKRASPSGHHTGRAHLPVVRDHRALCEALIRAHPEDADGWLEVGVRSAFSDPPVPVSRSRPAHAKAARVEESIIGHGSEEPPIRYRTARARPSDARNPRRVA